MREALYRKYRPKSLKEVIGQEPIAETLANALKSGLISHAYLFTGPRGVGKTSVARILAHEVNGLPYTDDSTHLDIIEIDAASNRRIDEIRDLREKVNIAPTSAKYKVYIIDEVHMLTKEAFNALLKTLEEPPAHVIFVLATTETHKVPATIISRTQRYPFKLVPANEMKKHLAEIAKAEKITVSSEALDKIVTYGEGSVRDSISLLDQVASQKDDITLSTIYSILGLPSDEHIENLLKAIDSNDPANILGSTQSLRVDGLAATQIAAELSKKLRGQLIADKEHFGKNKFQLLQDLLMIGSYSDPMSALEVALLNTIPAETPTTIASTEAKPAKVDSEPTRTAQPSEAKPAPQPEPVIETPIEPKPAKKTPETAKADLSAIDSETAFDKAWHGVLDAAKAQHSSLYGLLRMAEANKDGDKLILKFRFLFHAKQIKNQKHLDKLYTLLKENGLAGLEVKPEVDENIVEDMPFTPSESGPEQPPNEDIDTISNIFGGAELLD